MTKLRESTARERASGEVAALAAKLKEHATAVKDTLEGLTGWRDEHTKEALQKLDARLGALAADVREAGRAAPAPAAPSALEAQVQEHAVALAEAMRHLKESSARDTASDELRALAAKVAALAAAQQAASEKTVLAVEAQLRSHDDRLRDALQTTALNDVSSREELKGLERQVSSLRDATKDAFEKLIVQHTASLREDMSKLRESSARDRAADDLAALRSDVDALSRNPRSDESVVKAVEAQLALHRAHVDRALADATDDGTKEALARLQARMDDVVEASRSEKSPGVDERFVEAAIAKHGASLMAEMGRLKDAAAREKASDEIRVLREKLESRPAEDGVVQTLERQLASHTATIQSALKDRAAPSEELLALKSAVGAGVSCFEKVAELAARKPDDRAVVDAVERQADRLAAAVKDAAAASRGRDGDAFQTLAAAVDDLKRAAAAPPDTSALAKQIETHTAALRAFRSVAQFGKVFEMKLAGEEMRHLRESTSRRAADEVKNLREKFLEFQRSGDVAERRREDDLKSLQLDFRALQDTVARGLEDARRERRAVHEAPAPASESPRLKALERSIADIATGLKDDMARLRESTARDHAAGALASLSEKVSALQSRRPEEPASTVARNLEAQLAQHADRVQNAILNSNTRSDGVKDELRHLQQTMLDVQRQTRDAAEGKHADVSASVRNLEQQLASHSASLRDEMRHVTDGAARSAAAESYGASTRPSRAEAAARRRGRSAVAVKALELQLQQHTATIRDAITSTRSGDLGPTNCGRSSSRSWNREKSLEMRDLRDGAARDRASEEIKILTDRVGALSSSDDGGALKALETQLNQHTAIKETNAAGDARSRDARDDLRRLQEQVLALQEKQAQASAAAIGEIRDQTAQLKDDVGRLLRESTQAAAALSEKASADVRLLAEKVSALQAATNHDSAERDVVKVLEAQLAGHTQSLREAIVERRGETEGERVPRAELEGLKRHMDELRAAAAKPPPEPSTKALEEAIAAHTSSLREDSRVSSANVEKKKNTRRTTGEEMRHLRESTARDRAADDLTALAEKVARLEQGAPGQKDVAESLEAQLAQHTKTLTAAIEGGRGEDRRDDELRRLQAQVDDVRRQAEAAAPKTAPAPAPTDSETKAAVAKLGPRRERRRRAPGRPEPRRRGRGAEPQDEVKSLEARLESSGGERSRASAEKLDGALARQREALEQVLRDATRDLRDELRSTDGAAKARAADLEGKLERAAEARATELKQQQDLIRQKQLEDLASSRTRRGRRRDGDSSGDEASDQLKLLRRDLADLKRSREEDAAAAREALEDIAKQLGDVRQSQAPQVEDHHDEELLLRSRGARANRRSRQRYQADDDESPSAAARRPAVAAALQLQRDPQHDPRGRARAPRAPPVSDALRAELDDIRDAQERNAAAARAAMDVVQRQLGALAGLDAYDAPRTARAPARRRPTTTPTRPSCPASRCWPRAGDDAYAASSLDAVRGRLGPCASGGSARRRTRSGSSAARCGRRSTRRRDVAGEGQELRQMLGLMQDQLKTLDRVVGLEPFAATPRRDEPRDADLAAAEARAAKAQEDKAAADEDRDDAASRLEALERAAADPTKALVDRSRVVDALRAQLADADAAKDRAERATDVDGFARQAAEDLAAARREAGEWRRRAEGADRAWADLNRDRDAALAGERARAELEAREAEFLGTLAERDARCSSLQRDRAPRRDGEGDKRRADAVTVLRDALLKTQAEDVERARTALARTRDLLAARDALAAPRRRRGLARPRRVRDRRRTAEAQGAVGDVLAARATADHLNLELARERRRTKARKGGLGGAAGDSGGEQPPADASSRAIVFFDALAFDPTDLVVNDACPALAEHLRIDPSTPCTILGDGDSRSAAATRLAFFAVELDGRAGSVFHVADDATPGDAAAAPDIFAETAQRLAARSNVARGPGARAVGRRPDAASRRYARVTASSWPALRPRAASAEFDVAFARSDPAALMSLRLRGLDLTTMAAHLQRVRPWTTAADAEPVWLANKRAVLVSDLYAYVRTVCRGVLVDLGAAERAGIVFRGGSPPYEWVMVASTAFSVAPEEAEIDKGEELRLFRRLATELRTWLRHALPPPHELVLSRGELQRDLAAQQLVDDLHAWLRRSGCTEVSCADLVPFYGAFPRYRKGGGQGSGIKHAIVRFGGAKLSWPPTTPWDQAAERYRPLDVGFAPFRLPAPSREEPCPT
ncbi:hypothetical protein JL722_6378 [Aureococcus anophagefferens]|nr:hypothetical protein JL722_6378 [Aureococcus anophagefferens]